MEGYIQYDCEENQSTSAFGTDYKQKITKESQLSALYTISSSKWEMSVQVDHPQIGLLEWFRARLVVKLL